MGRWVESVRGLEVKVSGDFRQTELEMKQTDVERELRSRGAKVVADVRRTTDLLVRADSPLYKYDQYGDREAELARYRTRGSDGAVVEVKGLVAILNGLSVWARNPQAGPPEAAFIGAPYRPVTASSGIGVVLIERDPAAMERALAGHSRTQNLLADFVASRGFAPLSPVELSLQFDTAWETRSHVWVAEVKSMSEQNETIQLRLGLGQVLEYAWRLGHRHDRPTRAVLVPESEPHDHSWREVCETVGVVLTWPPFVALEKALAATS